MLHVNLNNGLGIELLCAKDPKGQPATILNSLGSLCTLLAGSQTDRSDLFVGYEQGARAAGWATRAS